MGPSEQLRFYAHELAAMARTGLQYVTNEYDRDRFVRTERIAEGIATLVMDAEFTPERPYLPDLGTATPKVGCSVAAFDADGKLVLIRRADNGRWALPGGWAEVGSTPAENALRELHEETGFVAELERVVGVYDNRRYGSASPYHIYTVCFSARVVGGEATPSIETPEVVVADPAALPENMSALQRAMARDAWRGEAAAVFQ